MIFKAVLISLFFHFTLGLVLFLSSDFSSDLAKYTNQEKSLFDVIAQSKQTGSLPQGMSEERLTQIKEYEDLLKKMGFIFFKKHIKRPVTFYLKRIIEQKCSTKGKKALSSKISMTIF